MTFNPELIAKARKGEIAILNDGSVEELYELLRKVWPNDFCMVAGANKYYFKDDDNSWDASKSTKLPAHSVKDFFMNTEHEKLVEIAIINPQDLTNEEKHKILSHKMTNDQVGERISEPMQQSQQPRTYRVTRSQMKEIWEAMSHPGGKLVIRNIISEQFDELENEAEITEGTIQRLEALPDIGATLRSIFPTYFYIPEGEPVLVRNRNDEGEPFEWYIRVSDGNGGSYVEGKTSGISTKWHETIAYTKNPPK